MSDLRDVIEAFHAMLRERETQLVDLANESANHAQDVVAMTQIATDRRIENEKLRERVAELEADARKRNAPRKPPAGREIVMVRDGDVEWHYAAEEIPRAFEESHLAKGLAFALAVAEYRATEPTLVDFVAAQREWSSRTFGEGRRTLGITMHVRKELREVESAHPGSRGQLEEWIDVAILALDGAWRTGAPPYLVVEMLLDKAKRNRERKWPDPSTLSQDEPSEHVRAEPAIEIVPWNECPECGDTSTLARFMCARCRADSEYCSADEEGCARRQGHEGPCRKRARR